MSELRYICLGNKINLSIIGKISILCRALYYFSMSLFFSHLLSVGCMFIWLLSLLSPHGMLCTWEIGLIPDPPTPAATPKLIHGWTQEDGGNRWEQTEKVSCWRDDRFLSWRTVPQVFHPSGTSLEEMTSLWASQGIALCELPRDMYHTLHLGSPLLVLGVGGWMDG